MKHSELQKLLSVRNFPITLCVLSFIKWWTVIKQLHFSTRSFSNQICYLLHVLNKFLYLTFCNKKERVWSWRQGFLALWVSKGQLLFREIRVIYTIELFRIVVFPNCPKLNDSLFPASGPVSFIKTFGLITRSNCVQDIKNWVWLRGGEENICNFLKWVPSPFMTWRCGRGIYWMWISSTLGLLRITSSYSILGELILIVLLLR